MALSNKLEVPGSGIITAELNRMLPWFHSANTPPSYCIKSAAKDRIVVPLP